MNNFIGIRVGKTSSGYSYEPDLLDYVSGLITPLTSSELTLLNNFIITVKSGYSISSLGDFYDLVYILGGQTQEVSLRNLARRLYDLTNIHSTGWVQYEGFTSDGANDYLKTGYNPSVNKINIAQNDASHGVYSRSNVSGIQYDVGCTDGTNYLSLITRSTPNTFPRINQDGSSITAIAIADSLGMISASRYAAAYVDVYKNKTTLGTITELSTAIPNKELYLLCLNNNGTPASYSTRQIAFYFLGKKMSTAQRDVLVDAFEVYMDAHGKGVI